MTESTPRPPTRVLVVEDDTDLREALCDTLELAGSTVLTAGNGHEALELLGREAVDLVVSDVNMPEMDGLELLQALRRQQPQLPVLLITAYGSISKSVEAMRCGAVDYLVKPFRPQLLVEAVSRFAGFAGGDVEQPVAEEVSSQRLLGMARRVAATDATALLLGESGTGKEVLARYIHQQSARRQGPFVAINCAAIPDNMLEAMLFGHEKGAFTGAHASSPGKFEQANGGTLLLDEISEMPLALQAKLLRVIQEREVERLGGRRAIALDVRLIATSNRDLQAAVRRGEFREDLFYRVSVFPLVWLPLRQRRADIPAIARSLLQRHLRKMGRPPARLSDAACVALAAHDWPGNVRELDNVIQRALILQPGVLIEPDDLCLDPYAGLPMMAGGEAPGEVQTGVDAAMSERSPAAADDAGALGEDLQRREFEIILETLRRVGGSRKTAAERLGISPRTLRYKLARMREAGFEAEAGLLQG